jgi:restriction system protein
MASNENSAGLSTNVASVPTYTDLIWPLVRALKEMGGSGKNADLLAKVIDLEKFTQDVYSQLQNESGNETKLGYNLAWTKTCLKKIGAINNSKRGVWSLTNAGEKLTAADVPQIKAQVHKILIDEKNLKDAEGVSPKLVDEDSILGAESATSLNPDELDTTWKTQTSCRSEKNAA